MKEFKILGHILLHMLGVAIVFGVFIVLAVLIEKFVGLIESTEPNIYILYAAIGGEILLFVLDGLLLLYAVLRLFLSMINKIRNVK